MKDPPPSLGNVSRSGAQLTYARSGPMTVVLDCAECESSSGKSKPGSELLVSSTANPVSAPRSRTSDDPTCAAVTLLGGSAAELVESADSKALNGDARRSALLGVVLTWLRLSVEFGDAAKFGSTGGVSRVASAMRDLTSILYFFAPGMDLKAILMVTCARLTERALTASSAVVARTT